MTNICTIALLLFGWPLIAIGQNPNTRSAQSSLVGVVTEIETAGRSVTVRSDESALIKVMVGDDTNCLRVPAGEKTLAKAASIPCAEIAVGDRVLSHGVRAETSFQAQRLVILTKDELVKKREQDLADWQRRGVGGVVRELNGQTGEINLELRGTSAGTRLTIASNQARFLRYSPASLRFEDARTSNFAELKVGDQLRALGDKSADGQVLKAEKIVSGVFKTAGVTITEIDLQRKEIKGTTLDQKKPIVISLTEESVLRRIPPPVAQAIAQKALAGTTPANGSTAAPRPRPASPNIDVQQVIDSLPKISISDLKSGDVLAVTSAVDKDESRLTAIKLVAGVDLVLRAMAPQPGRPQVVRLSAGLPTVFDFSVVQ